jgi:ankyrin repeat protein
VAVSPLLQALYEGRRDDALALAAGRDDLDVFEAAALGDTFRVHTLVADEPALARARSVDGFTALHLAAFLGSLDAMVVLLDAGADVAAVADNAMRVQPLHSAAAARDTPKCALLLLRDAPVNAVQQGGFTALHEAAMHGALDRVELLLRNGADPNLANDEGRTPIDLARDGHHRAVVARLHNA